MDQNPINADNNINIYGSRIKEKEIEKISHKFGYKSELINHKMLLAEIVKFAVTLLNSPRKYYPIHCLNPMKICC